MTHLDDLDYGDEIRGVVCPRCGGSLVWNKGRAYCDEHRYVEPEHESLAVAARLSEEDEEWLRQNMEDEYEG